MSPVEAIIEDRKRTVETPPKTQKQLKKSKIIRRKYKAKDADPTSPVGILLHQIQKLLIERGLDNSDISNDMPLILNDPEYEQQCHRIVENVEILELTSGGDGLAIIAHPIEPDSKKQIVLVPFGLPGDVCKIKVFKSHPSYVESDLLEVSTPSNYRDDLLINCKYFGKCSGCQFQSVPYEQQLLFKRDTIVNAYKYLAPQLTKEEVLPSVLNTEPSPLQYSYRTKLTPHFNLPYKLPKEYDMPTLGFGSKGRPKWRPEVQGGDASILDIEDCSIGTEIINIGMRNERERFAKDYKNYKKGATILLREDTRDITDHHPEEKHDPRIGSTDASDEVSVKIYSQNGHKYLKTCVTNPRQIVYEYVNGYKFEFSAGEFFQNNNSILPAVTGYVKDNLLIPGSSIDEPNYLVDAYCGSGLFSITCSTGVSKVIGVEVSADSVKFAERNAASNRVENTKFIVGKAEEIFKSIDTPCDRTSVILDPPRKGCDDVFLNQLSDYNPAKIVYISCNVHSQARDVEWFLKNTGNGARYRVESIKGFDFFPQTHHVESVAVLVRI